MSVDRFLDTNVLESVLAPLLRVQPSLRLYHAPRSLDIKSRYGFAYYDALIVAAALDAGCATLYSEDRCRIDNVSRV